MPMSRKFIAAPLLAGILVPLLAGCAGTSQATSTVTVTATPGMSSAAAADMPNDHSSPDELVVSMFRDIQNKDAKKFLDLFDKELADNYRVGIMQSVELADVSKYSDFTVTSVHSGWSGNDETTAAGVYYTVMYDGQLLKGEVEAVLDDPNYAPNTWTLGEYGIPSGYNNQVYTKNGVDEIPLTLSGNGQKILLDGQPSETYLFPGVYTVTGKVDANKNMTSTVQSTTLNALQRP